MLDKAFLYPDRERGTSLIEAMVSVAILAIITLGLGLVISSSYHTITATELDIHQQQQGMHTEVFGTTLPTAQTLSMSVIVPGGGGNPLLTVANPVSLIPVDNLLTLSIGAGTGVTSSTESVQYGVIRNGENQWWIP
jgi:type II secretory pathway pseudopilin PulG